MFAIVIDVVTNEIIKGMLQEILYADDLVLIAETMAEPRKNVYSWKSALDCKCLKVNLLKTKVMLSKIAQFTVIPSIRKDSCGICGRKTMAKVLLCKSYGYWIHGRCAKIESVTNSQSLDLECRKCKRCHEI